MRWQGCQRITAQPEQLPHLIHQARRPRQRQFTERIMQYRPIQEFQGGVGRVDGPHGILFRPAHVFEEVSDFGVRQVAWMPLVVKQDKAMDPGNTVGGGRGIVAGRQHRFADLIEEARGLRSGRTCI